MFIGSSFSTDLANSTSRFHCSLCAFPTTNLGYQQIVKNYLRTCDILSTKCWTIKAFTGPWGTPQEAVYHSEKQVRTIIHRWRPARKPSSQARGTVPIQKFVRRSMRHMWLTELVALPKSTYTKLLWAQDSSAYQRLSSKLQIWQTRPVLPERLLALNNTINL